MNWLGIVSEAAHQQAKEDAAKVEAENMKRPITATMFADAGWNVVAFGSAPNPHRAWSYEQGSGARLTRLCGKKITWFNLFATEPERWSAKDAKASAEEWCEKYAKRHRVPLLLLGTKVCSAFGIEDPEWLETYASQLWSPMIAFPHPSGLNRWWNDPENERRAWMVARGVANGTYFRYLKGPAKEDE